jgi:CelD/BcsL family acetyltransferase involved in cellulose biosynthesis
MCRTEVLPGPGFYTELRAPWQALIADAPSATPFQTWEWQETWHRHYGRHRKGFAIAVWVGDDLVGLMPFVRSRSLCRTVRPAGIGPSDYLQPLARRGFEEDVAIAIAYALSEMPDVDLVDLHQVRETQPLAARFPSVESIDQATCLVLDLPSTYDRYLSMLGKSLRYDVRKLDKGHVTIEMATEGTASASLEILFDQHRRRWKKRGLPGAFLGRAPKFHADWVQQAIRNRWLRLGVLRKEGTAIGAIYAMNLGETTYYYQAGFDPAFASASPGTLLVAHTIREAINDGATRFDFMRGDEPYKRRWKPQHAYSNRRILVPGAGILGRVGDSWNRAGWRVEAQVRARLEGKGLIG